MLNKIFIHFTFKRGGLLLLSSVMELNNVFFLHIYTRLKDALEGTGFLAIVAGIFCFFSTYSLCAR